MYNSANFSETIFLVFPILTEGGGVPKGQKGKNKKVQKGSNFFFKVYTCIGKTQKIVSEKFAESIHVLLYQGSFLKTNILDHFIWTF